MLCVLILYILSGGTYSLKSTPNDRFFLEKLFMAILFTLRVFARNLLRGNRRRNTFRILFWCLAWDSNPGFLSSKPTNYLLDHGDFSARRHFIDLFHLNSMFWKQGYLCILIIAIIKYIHTYVCMYVCKYNIIFNYSLDFVVSAR